MILFMRQELYCNGKLLSGVEKVELQASRDISSASLKVRLQSGESKIRQGDRVVWKAGYKRTNQVKAELFEEFTGTITEITPSRPIEFLARDDMFLASLKKVKSNFSTLPVSAYVRKLLSYLDISPIIKIDSSIASKSVYENIYNHSVRYALWKLTDIKYGCDIFFKGDTLYVENQLDKKKKEPEAIFGFYDTIIKSTLKGRGLKTDFGKKEGKEGPLKKLSEEIKVEVVSENVKTGRISRASHGKGSDKRIYFIDNLKSTAVAKKAKEIYEELTGEGFTGYFTTFGFPSVSLNDVILIVDPIDDQRTGTNIVQKLVKKYNVSQATYRQIIYPGKFVEKPKRRYRRRKARVKKKTSNPEGVGVAVEGTEGSKTIIDVLDEKYNYFKQKYKKLKGLF